MKTAPSLIALAAALLAPPAVAWADRNPDFENDALPILKQQTGLPQYVHAHFVVKEAGVARIPGSSQAPPQPPFIFSAKPRGASGPFYLRLLIQPGGPGHILKVADIRKLPGQVPPSETVPGEPVNTPTAPQPAAASAPADLTPPPDPSPVTPQTTTPAPTSSSDAPTAATPSGPIQD